jgi:indolepyruvate decarboxylase
MAPLRLPRGVTFIGQPLWASSGYALPAMLGACLARALSRGVLLIGDGAAQMTVQELSTILREEIWAVVVVVDNDGYTVERAIHGPDQPYNDIARWDWERLPAVFAPGQEVSVAVVRTNQELDAALAATREAWAPSLSLIRAQVPRMDVPDLLANLTQAMSPGADETPSL